MLTSVREQTTLLQRHLAVLQQVVEREPIGIKNIASETEYAHHEVRYSLRRLQDNSVIEPSPQGADTTDKTDQYITDLNDDIDSLNEQLMALKVEQDTA